MHHSKANDPMQLSADDVLAIPVPPHLRGYELEDGELVAVSLPAPPHGRLVAEVLFRIKLHLHQNRGAGRAYGEVGTCSTFHTIRNDCAAPTSHS